MPKKSNGVENREANGVVIHVVGDVKGRGGCG